MWTEAVGAPKQQAVQIRRFRVGRLLLSGDVNINMPVPDKSQTKDWISLLDVHWFQDVIAVPTY